MRWALLIQVMGPEDGPITSEVVKVVHDDGHKQVEDQEGGHNKEGCEVDIGNIATTTSRFVSFITRNEMN